MVTTTTIKSPYTCKPVKLGEGQVHSAANYHKERSPPPYTLARWNLQPVRTQWRTEKSLSPPEVQLSSYSLQPATFTTGLFGLMATIDWICAIINFPFVSFCQRAVTCDFVCLEAVQISPLCNGITTDDIYWNSGYRTEGIASRFKTIIMALELLQGKHVRFEENATFNHVRNNTFTGLLSVAFLTISMETARTTMHSAFSSAPPTDILSLTIEVSAIHLRIHLVRPLLLGFLKSFNSFIQSHSTKGEKHYEFWNGSDEKQSSAGLF
jgi:hypothetical protein